MFRVVLTIVALLSTSPPPVLFKRNKRCAKRMHTRHKWYPFAKDVGERRNMETKRPTTWPGGNGDPLFHFKKGQRTWRQGTGRVWQGKGTKFVVVRGRVVFITFPKYIDRVWDKLHRCTLATLACPPATQWFLCACRPSRGREPFFLFVVGNYVLCSVGCFKGSAQNGMSSVLKGSQVGFSFGQGLLFACPTSSIQGQFCHRGLHSRVLSR